jgi:D-alanyl-lipoteichoic acid acyltransferase DltB (MBOAT superfamily)
VLFNSLPFLLFLPLVVVLFYVLPHRHRWIMLLAASYYFYMGWKPVYALLIVASTLVDYAAALLISQSRGAWRRRCWLAVSLSVNLGALTVFKYYGFFRGELAALIGEVSWLPMVQVALPVGISFYTFQTMGYTIDVYRGKHPPESHLGIFGLYVAYFPQLVAGPIERWGHLGRQLRSCQRFHYPNLAKGARLILYGLFVKMAIADNVSPYVDQVFANYEALGGAQLAMGMCLYSVQIYADFYGYSLIAIGSARLMGIRLMDNFRMPYLSVSIKQFWARWHISLTTWFREYLYLPLGGNRVGAWRWMANIAVVFGLSGLWHGANWTFLVWGGMHGAMYLAEHGLAAVWKPGRWAAAPGWRLLGWAKTVAVVTLAWVFFRSPNLEHALGMLSRLVDWPSGGAQGIQPGLATCFLLLLFGAMEVAQRRSRFDRWIGAAPAWLRWLAYAALVFGIMALGGLSPHPFIYFQF